MHKFEKTIREENSLSTISNQATSNARFRDNAELKYSLRSIDLYAPWLNKVYIITDQQIPQWIDTSSVTIVDHEDIFPSNVAKPVFNSNVIELCMHRIPGLQEHFIAFNDDMMLSAPVYPRDFFSDTGKPIMWVVKENAKKFLESVSEYHADSERQRATNRTLRIFIDAYQTIPPYKLKHTPKPWTVSGMHCFWDEFHSFVQESLQYRLRNEKNLITIVAFAFFMLLTDRASPREIYGAQRIVDMLSGRCRHIGASLGDPLWKRRMRKIRSARPLTFCLNDAEPSSQQDRDELQLFFKEMFPAKSRFER